MLKTRWIAASSLVLALFVPNVAAADIISIGTLEWNASIEFLPWPDPSGVGFNILPITGTDASATNLSAVNFLNVDVRAEWHYLSTHAFNTCSAATLAPGATLECGTGPVMLAPALPNGIGYFASVSGTLGAASFLLADGSTFIPTSTTFGRSYSWMYITDGPPAMTRLDILVEGTVIPPTPSQSVPEPGTLALLLGGALSVYGGRRRLA